ncbi:MAG: tRNA threonylcarbamoyladenosine dehydratase [Bacteroidales bacterium]|nr:tRNA threonylcarbamoyladenosine dehydratase [Bacteroidales bacterium]
MSSEAEYRSRSRLLLGDEVMNRLASARVIVFGVGGVGSWAAEALVRTGLVHLTIVDSDEVAPSNINRQLPATVETLGEPKVKALRDHLLTVNPGADIVALEKAYTAENAAEFELEKYDYVIDAIDSLSCKAHLILHVTSLKRVKLFSSMGAATRIDPTAVKVAEFWKVQGCPLARALRNKFRRSGMKPRHAFKCVFSEEQGCNRGAEGFEATATGTWDASKAAINGSLITVTGTFGFTLASLVIRDLLDSGPA